MNVAMLAFEALMLKSVSKTVLKRFGEFQLVV